MPESYCKEVISVMTDLQIRRKSTAAFAGKKGKSRSCEANLTKEELHMCDATISVRITDKLYTLFPRIHNAARSVSLG